MMDYNELRGMLDAMVTSNEVLHELTKLTRNELYKAYQAEEMRSYRLEMGAEAARRYFHGK